MLPKPKKYTVKAATIREFDGLTVMLVIIPWAHYANQLCVTAYGTPLRAANIEPIIAGVNPNGALVYYETQLKSTLLKFLEKTPFERIPFHPLQIEDRDGWIGDLGSADRSS